MIAELSQGGGAHVKELVDAVEQFEQVADELETKAETVDDGSIPDIDGCWNTIGQALGTGSDSDDEPDETCAPKQTARPVQAQPAPQAPAEAPEQVVQAKPAPAPAPKPDPQPVQQQPAAEPVTEPAAATRPEPAAEAPAPKQIEIKVIPAATVQEPQKLQKAPEPQQAPAPRPQAQAKPNIQPVDEGCDLQTWPAEVDVVRAEQAEQTRNQLAEQSELQPAGIEMAGCPVALNG